MRALSLSSTTLLTTTRRVSSALLAAVLLSACTTEIITEVPSSGGGGSGQNPTPAPVTVQRIELSGASWMLEQASASYSATVIGSNGSVLTDRAVTWTSSDTAVATIVGSGVVYAKRAGEVTLTVVAENKYAVMRVAVRPLVVDTVIVRLSGGALYAGEASWIGAELRAADGRLLERPVSWASLDPSVATVDAQGRVTGLKPGVVTIVATSEGRTGRIQVTVGQPRIRGTWQFSIADLRNNSTLCTYTNLGLDVTISGNDVTGALMYDVWTGTPTGTLTCVALVGGSGTPTTPAIPAGPFTGRIEENGYMTLTSGNGWQFTGMVNRTTGTWTGTVIVRDGEPTNGIVPVRTGTFTAKKS